MCVHTVYITSSPDSPPHIHTYVIPAPVTAKHLLPPRPRLLLEARPCPRCGPRCVHGGLHGVSEMDLGLGTHWSGDCLFTCVLVLKSSWFPAWCHAAPKKTVGTPPVPREPALSEIGTRIHVFLPSFSASEGRTQVSRGQGDPTQGWPGDRDQEQVTRHVEPGTLPLPSSLGPS